MRNKLLIFSLFLSLFSSYQTYCRFDDTESLVQAAVTTGCLAGAGYIGYKYLKSIPSQEERADKELKGYLEQKIGKDPVRIAAQQALKKFELLAYEDREKLLPAIISIDNNLRTFIDSMTLARAECHDSFENYKKAAADHAQKVIRSDEAIALHATIISPHIAGNHREAIDCLLKQHPENLFIKNETNPRIFLSAPLRAGECAIIGYSDGDIQIHLHDSDRRLLNELSNEQRDFIKALAQRFVDGNTSINLNRAQTAHFYSLPSEMQACLKKNYPLKTLPQFITRETEKVLWWTANLFDLARYGQLIYEGKYLTCFVRLWVSAGCGHVADLVFPPNQRRRFSLPYICAHISGTEAIMNGHKIIPKLGSLFSKSDQAA